eukprot:6207584-Pleurochrysis_carterae.AAC.1
MFKLGGNGCQRHVMGNQSGSCKGLAAYGSTVFDYFLQFLNIGFGQYFASLCSEQQYTLTFIQIISAARRLVDSLLLGCCHMIR